MTDFAGGFIDEQIKSGNLPAARDFVKQILPQVYHSVADLPFAVRKHYSLADSPIRPDLIDAYGLSADDAVSYISSIISDYKTRPALDRDYLRVCIQHTDERIYDLIALAAYNVDVEMLDHLSFGRDNGSVSVIMTASTRFQTDNIDVNFEPSEPWRDISNAEVKRCLSLLVKMGCKASDAVSRLGTISNSKNLLESTSLLDSRRFELNELPVVSGGVVRNPALLHAFSGLQGDALYDRLVSHVPCLIKNEDVNRFSSRMIFQWKVKIYGVEGNNRHYASIDDFKSDAVMVQGETKAVNTTACYVSAGALLTESSYFVKENSYGSGLDFGFTNCIGSTLLSQILSINACLGENAPDGYSLALIDVEELALASEVVQESNSQEIDISRIESMLCNQKFLSLHNKSGQHNLTELPINDSLTPLKIASLALSGKCHLEIVNEEFIRAALSKSSKSVPVNVLVYGRDHLGLNFDDKELLIEHKDIPELVAAGFKVSGKHKLNNKDFPKLSNTDRIAWMRMGGWYSALPRPVSVEDAIKKASARRDENVYELYLATFPLDELIPKCRTARTKQILGQVFTPEELEPYVDRLADATLTTTLIEAFNL